eukprot:1143647-Pelagomonas_calceolata.AAC.2
MSCQLPKRGTPCLAVRATTLCRTVTPAGAAAINGTAFYAAATAAVTDGAATDVAVPAAAAAAAAATAAAVATTQP